MVESRELQAARREGLACAGRAKERKVLRGVCVLGGGCFKVCEEGGRYLLLEACRRFFRPEFSSQIHYQLHGLGQDPWSQCGSVICGMRRGQGSPFCDSTRVDVYGVGRVARGLSVAGSLLRV